MARCVRIFDEEITSTLAAATSTEALQQVLFDMSSFKHRLSDEATEWERDDALESFSRSTELFQLLQEFELTEQQQMAVVTMLPVEVRSTLANANIYKVSPDVATALLACHDASEYLVDWIAGEKVTDIHIDWNGLVSPAMFEDWLENVAKHSMDAIQKKLCTSSVHVKAAVMTRLSMVFPPMTRAVRIVSLDDIVYATTSQSTRSYRPLHTAPHRMSFAGVWLEAVSQCEYKLARKLLPFMVGVCAAHFHLPTLVRRLNLEQWTYFARNIPHLTASDLDTIHDETFDQSVCDWAADEAQMLRTERANMCRVHKRRKLLMQ